jgi:hypothetical protein
MLRLEASTKVHLGEQYLGTLATFLKSSPFRPHKTQRRRFSLTRTLFRIGPLNLGLFSVPDTPSHSICPLTYSHHGLLVSDTLII